MEEVIGGGISCEIKKLAYRTAMGATDIVTAGFVTGGYGVVLTGVVGYAEQGLEGAQRGLSPDVIQEEALLMGLGDAAMGKVLGNAGDTTLLKSLLEGAGTDAVSSIVTNGADTLLAGDRSHVALDYQIGRAAGLSDEEARQAANNKEVKRIVGDALQGMLMAGVFNTAGKIIRVADAHLGFEDRGNLPDDGKPLRESEESVKIQREESATEETGRGGEGGSGIDFDLSKLSRSQQTAIKSADNIINDHLKSSDLSAALGDLQGNPIAKPNGGYWNHAQEVKDAYIGLVRAEKTLAGSLQNPNLAPDARAFIQGKYDTISNYISIIEDIFAPYGGIN